MARFLTRYGCMRLWIGQNRKKLHAPGFFLIGFGMLVSVGIRNAGAQAKTSTDWAWKPLLQHKGVEFSFLFYSEADNANNGVVIKLANTNNYPVVYHFKVVFRSDEKTHVEAVNGFLREGEVKTGSSAGLFWIPFTDGCTISEVELRGYKVSRLTEAPP